MNCPSRADSAAIENGWNQNPNPLALDSNNDANGIANLRLHRDHRLSSIQLQRLEHEAAQEPGQITTAAKPGPGWQVPGVDGHAARSSDEVNVSGKSDGRGSSCLRRCADASVAAGGKLRRSAVKYAKFMGPGFMIAVAYIDPGNYATDVVAGASFQYRLLVMVLVANLAAIFLQSLCIKLGSVTGLNLAENVRAHCPPWLNYTLWFFAECAIISTDIAEVIGTAIALNLLINVPVVAGCAISIVDVLIILIFYRPSGSMRGLRAFETFVTVLVLGVVICFAIELSLLNVPDVGEVFKGYLPSSALVQSQGVYQACGILGATVMPHSLYLGSGIVQPRLREYDERHGNIPTAQAATDDEPTKYRPTLAAIRSCMTYSIVELTVSLFTFALFVNSAILIVSGASLSSVTDAQNPSLFSIHALLSRTLAPIAGTLFALALLLSGTSAGIVCTIAGQMVSEGQLRWSVRPWVRRLLTRSLSITPSIIVAGAVGKAGLSRALVGSQVVLSVILPFTSAPLIYFTCRNKIMTVRDVGDCADGVKMRNGRIVAVVAVLLWLLIVVMNVALLVLLALGG